MLSALAVFEVAQELADIIPKLGLLALHHGLPIVTLVPQVVIGLRAIRVCAAVELKLMISWRACKAQRGCFGFSKRLL